MKDYVFDILMASENGFDYRNAEEIYSKLSCSFPKYLQTFVDESRAKWLRKAYFNQKYESENFIEFDLEPTDKIGELIELFYEEAGRLTLKQKNLSQRYFYSDMNRIYNRVEKLYGQAKDAVKQEKHSYFAIAEPLFIRFNTDLTRLRRFVPYIGLREFKGMEGLPDNTLKSLVDCTESLNITDDTNHANHSNHANYANLDSEFRKSFLTYYDDCEKKIEELKKKFELVCSTEDSDWDEKAYLSDELENAVAMEDYELATVLKEKISGLTKV